MLKFVQEIFSNIMQYAGMSEDPSGAEGDGGSGSGKFGGLLSASHSLSDLQEEESEGDDNDDAFADGHGRASSRRRVHSPPPPPPPAPVAAPPLAPGQLSKSASAIKSSLMGSGETAKPAKRTFSYFDGMS